MSTFSYFIFLHGVTLRETGLFTGFPMRLYLRRIPETGVVTKIWFYNAVVTIRTTCFNIRSHSVFTSFIKRLQKILLFPRSVNWLLFVIKAYCFLWGGERITYILIIKILRRRTALLLVITQQVVAISYRRFEATNRYRLQGSRNEMAFRYNLSVRLWRAKNPNPLRSSTPPEDGNRQVITETSVRDCHHSLRNDPEECTSQLHRGRSLKPGTMNFSLRKDSVAHAHLLSSAWICLNSQCASSSGQADSATWYRSAMAYVITEPLWRNLAGLRTARFVNEE